ncbi:Cell division protein ZipA [Phocoenobacter uteri]|uniref:Cell division protein ZipA n=1 Tax=Phocoenobacter uteri TaxID=146806 RepID=A0A379CBC2_9PAST|nr:cell division protein ZipA [Phocoenobacter uteri]MDG6881551.1 hypothetical protein [Phocoenobacter uteri]SUB59581.1 Cell division protein ZipA [Phocoenobacter uteri]
MELSVVLSAVALILVIILIGYTLIASNKEKSQVFENDFSARPRPASPLKNTSNKPFYESQNVMSEQEKEVVSETVTTNPEKSIEPTESAIKIRLDDETSVQEQETQPAVVINQEVEQPQEDEMQEPVESEPETEQDVMEQVLTLYLVAPEHQQFSGRQIVQHLEEIGFQYGEHKLFHRHIDNAASPVIFSVANMVQPGTFDLDNLDEFTTIGLAFFMYVPSCGNDVTNLRLMISTVESLSQSLGGFVLNDKQALFDEQSHIEYTQRLQ